MPEYVLTELVAPPDAWSVEITGINNLGEACGLVYTNEAIRAARWSGGVTVLDTSAEESVAYGLNDSGTVVGLRPIAYPSHAMIWKSGQAKDISAKLLAPESWATDVNGTGFVTGSMGPIAGTRAFLYDSGAQKTTTIGPLPGHAMAFGHAINDSRHVAGISQDAEWKNAHAFMYADGQLVDRGVASWVTGINATDTIVGSKAFRGAPTWTAYRQPLGGAFENLGTTSKPGFNGSHGNAINDSGVVVGHAFATGSSVFRAFVHFPAGSDEPGWFDLQDVTNNLGAWILESAVGINGSGQIAGNGHIGNDDQGRGFLLTPKKSQLFAPKDLSKYAIAFIALIGGVEAGAGGIGILPGGKPVPIDPHGWRALSPAERDLRIGLAVSRVAALLDDRGSARTIERAAKEIVRRSVAKLEQ